MEICFGMFSVNICRIINRSKCRLMYLLFLLETFIRIRLRSKMISRLACTLKPRLIAFGISSERNKERVEGVDGKQEISAPLLIRRRCCCHSDVLLYFSFVQLNFKFFRRFMCADGKSQCEHFSCSHCGKTQKNIAELKKNV